RNEMSHLVGSTQIIIAPGYQFHIVGGMVTNFHQPQSTLLLLVSAFLGGNWRQVYDFALANDFRFLSYGDACLFL
ncbi:MAG: S-adenosylmethionine:tRNA ribosyltransferase-isomerase, partial [Candidatus Limisoma sp.]